MRNGTELESPPLEAKRLYSWALGPRVAEWSERTEPATLSALEMSINQAVRAIGEIDTSLNDLRMLKGEMDLIPSDDYKSEEMRLTILREKNANILSSLIKSRSTLNAGGVAVLMAGMIRQSAAAAMTARPPERDVTQRRPLRRDSMAVVDAENDCS